MTEAPLLDLTDDILAQVREITDGLAHVGALLPTERRISLRRANRIRTVHASLAVEGNTLDLDEVEAVLDGRQVVGPAREIQEVRNALDAYERMSTWDPLCALLPVEHVVRDRQSAYYAALRQADRAGRSTPFVSFMLGAILDALAAATPQVTPQVERLLEALDGEMSRNELQGRLGLSDRKHFRARYLEPAVAASLIEMTIPDRPRSSKQRYRLTSKGRRVKGSLK